MRAGYFRMTDDGRAELFSAGYVPGKTPEFNALWSDEARLVARTVRTPLWVAPLLAIAALLWRWFGKPPVTLRTRWGRALRWLQGRQVRVSTVFLVIDHNYGTHDEPVLWETMIFGWRREYQERYSSLPDALLGHEIACRKAFHWFRPETEFGDCVRRYQLHSAREQFADSLKRGAA